MNNARYIRYLNFTRRHFFRKTGIWQVVEKEKGNMIVVAQTIRYRRELKFFDDFSIETRIVCFSDLDKVFYVESRFKDLEGFICAVHYLKYKLVGKDIQSPSVILDTASGKASHMWDVATHGTDTNFIAAWNKANSISSEELNPRM